MHRNSILLIGICVWACLGACNGEGGAASVCSKNEDCFGVAPTSLVECVQGRCACQGPCFELDRDSKTCTEVHNACVKYDEETLQCRDTRKSQTTAFFLAVFFGMTGAANFYIGRLNYAIPQLALLVLGTLCGGACRTIRPRAEEEPLTGGKPKMGLLRWAMGFIPLVVLIWWVVDIFIFATGERSGHDHCPLKPDF